MTQIQTLIETPTTQRIHETLEWAAAILEERGLAKGVLVDGADHVCLRGALITALTGDANVWPSRLDLGLLHRCEEALGFKTIEGPCLNPELPEWNNAPERTLEDVLARLDEAIERTRPVEERTRPIEEHEPELVLN